MSELEPVYTADEFEREARYLEGLAWEAIAVEPDAKVLICGYGDDGAAVVRALGYTPNVTVIEHREAAIARFAGLGAKLLRGSTSVIPARENTFDLAIAFHYLHEVDPLFHAQVLSELSRVARRIAVVEPAPPADALGKRIALLYSQAKRELGQFEYYQPMEYWKKMLQSAKADIAQHVFAFSKAPPREYLADTITLLLHTIAVEQAPKDLVDELRRIAGRSDAQLLPPPRFVLVGAALGELPLPTFSARETPPAAVTIARPARPAARAEQPPPAPAAPAAVTREAGYEFPPVDAPAAPARAPHAKPQPVPPAAPAPAPGPSPSVPAASPPAGSPAAPAGPTPFGAPFAVPPPDPFGAPPPGIPASTTWQWEPPDPGGDGETPFGPG